MIKQLTLQLFMGTIISSIKGKELNENQASLFEDMKLLVIVCIFLNSHGGNSNLTRQFGTGVGFFPAPSPPPGPIGQPVPPPPPPPRPSCPQGSQIGIEQHAESDGSSHSFCFK